MHTYAYIWIMDLTVSKLLDRSKRMIFVYFADKHTDVYDTYTQ